MSVPDYQGISQYLFYSSGSDDEELGENFIQEKKLSDEAVKQQFIEKRSISMTKADLKMLKENLMLPKPMTLQAKTILPRENVYNVYDFAMKKCFKFNGSDCDDDCIFENYYDVDEILFRVDQERDEEKSNLKDFADEEIAKIPFPKLMDVFMDEENIVYKRDPSQLCNSYVEFNKSNMNLKKYFRQSMEKNKKTRERVTTENPENINEEFENCYYQPLGPEDTTLVFESKFESGNLSMASRVSENEYNLIMQNDVNTFGYGQWFFFETRNTRRFNKVKFNILNFRKQDSLHNYGMKILIYSMQESDRTGKGWTRGGKNIRYQCTEIVRANRPQKFYRSLTFEYEYQYDYDRVFFAFTYPYTYTDLCDYLDKIENVTAHSAYLLRSTLCRTIAGNKCELLTITNNSNPGECDLKKCIVLTARVHPGETQASFMIQGVIDFLISDKPEAVILRDKFIFKIIPMLNPDGVIHGNYRCDLSGMDLNRRWRKPSQLLTPTIHHVKNLMTELKSRYKIAFYCDFHGHSKKYKTEIPLTNRKSIFMYGCEDERNPYRCREFPYILSKVSPEFFEFDFCHYNKTKAMAGTARQSVNEQLHVIDSYTLEASFHGSEKTGKHFTMQNFIQFGHHFAKSLAIYFSKMLGHSDKHKDLESMLLNDQERKNLDVRENFIKELHKVKLSEGDDSGSESEASEDDLPADMRAKLFPGQSKKSLGKHMRRSSALPESSQTKRDSSAKIDGATSASPTKLKLFKTIAIPENKYAEDEDKKSSNINTSSKTPGKTDKKSDIPLILPPRISLLPQFPTPRKLQIHRKEFPTPFLETQYQKRLKNHIVNKNQEAVHNELSALRLGPNRLDKTQPPGQFYMSPNPVEPPPSNTALYNLNLNIDKKTTIKSEPHPRTITPSKFYATVFRPELVDSPIRSQILSRLRMGKRQGLERIERYNMSTREPRETTPLQGIEELKLDTPTRKTELKSYRMNENVIEVPPIKKKFETTSDVLRPRGLRSTKLMSSRRSSQGQKPEMIKMMEDRKRGRIDIYLKSKEIQQQDEQKLMHLLEKFINSKGPEKLPIESNAPGGEGIMVTEDGLHGYITNETRRSMKCEAAFQDYNLHESPNSRQILKGNLVGSHRKKSNSAREDYLQSLLLRRASQSEERGSIEARPPIKTTTYRIKDHYESYENRVLNRDTTPPQPKSRK